MGLRSFRRVPIGGIFAHIWPIRAGMGGVLSTFGLFQCIGLRSKPDAIISINIAAMLALGVCQLFVIFVIRRAVKSVVYSSVL